MKPIVHQNRGTVESVVVNTDEAEKCENSKVVIRDSNVYETTALTNENANILDSPISNCKPTEDPVLNETVIQKSDCENAEDNAGNATTLLEKSSVKLPTRCQESVPMSYVFKFRYEENSGSGQSFTQAESSTKHISATSSSMGDELRKTQQQRDARFQKVSF